MFHVEVVTWRSRCPGPAGSCTRDVEAGLKDLRLAVAGLQGRQNEVSPLLLWLGGGTRPCSGEGWTNGWEHPSSLLFVEVWLFRVSAWMVSALQGLLRDLVSLADGSCLISFVPVRQQPTNHKGGVSKGRVLDQ